MSSRSRIPGKVTALSTTLLVTGAVLLNQGVAPATPGQGAIERTDVGQGRHTADGVMKVHQGNDTVTYTATMAPGATSGWHRHHGGIVVLVKSGTFTSLAWTASPASA